jgi:hypothetical protein
VTVEHPRGSAANFVDIFDLPGRVMQERDGEWLEQQVVMVGGASQEGGGPSDLVTHFEPNAIDEEALRSFGVGRADDHVTQFAGADRYFAQYAWCASVQSVRTPRPVVRLDRNRIL